MVAKKNTLINFLKPTEINEELLLDQKNILEILFLWIITNSEKLVKKYLKIDRIRDYNLFKNFLLDSFIVFLFLLIICSFLILLPYGIIEYENVLTNIWEIVFLLIFGSISWTGLVYIIQQYRELIQNNFLDVIQEAHPVYVNILKQFFNGTVLKWKRGFIWRFHYRTVFLSLIITIVTIFIFRLQIPNLINIILMKNSIEAYLLFFSTVFTTSFLAFFTFILFYNLFTIFFIFFLLFFIFNNLPLGLNPYIEMAGTEKYGKFIVNSLYLISFTIGVIPLVVIIQQINFNTILIQQLSSQTIGNITHYIGQITIETISDISLNSVSTYSDFIIIFIFFLGFALCLIGILHKRIKEHKNEEKERIKNILKDIDFYEIDNPNISNQNQYLLFLYEKVLSSHEWP